MQKGDKEIEREVLIKRMEKRSMGRYISDEGRMIGSGGEFTLKVKKR